MSADAESQKPLAIDLCCGLGGWTAGLLAEGFCVVGYDIERHEYGDERYPGELVLQDVLTLDGAQFRDATLIVASPPCFVAGTLILTARGLIPIPEVAVGDFVLTHRNRWRRVLRTGSTMAATMMARGFGGFLEGTAEHPIYARRNEGGFSVWNKDQKAPVNVLKTLGEPEWIPLGDIKGCHWAGAAKTSRALQGRRLRAARARARARSGSTRTCAACPANPRAAKPPAPRSRKFRWRCRGTSRGCIGPPKAPPQPRQREFAARKAAPKPAHKAP